MQATRINDGHACAPERERALALWLLALIGTRKPPKAAYSATNTVILEGLHAIPAIKHGASNEIVQQPVLVFFVCT